MASCSLAPVCEPALSKRAHRLLLLVVAAFVLALVVFGITCHRVSVPGGEYDFYAERAELLASGVLANDVFHGWLVPLLITAATPCVGDAFATGRVLSALSAGAVVYATHRLAHARFGGVVATCTTVLLVGNPIFLRLGVQVASDMPAAAFLLLAVMLQQQARTWRGWLCAGLGLGAAIATRPNYVPMAGIFVVAAWFADRAGAALGGGRFLALLAGSVVGLLPHLVLTVAQFGSLWVNENWRVLASKAANWDLAPLQDPAPGGLLSVLSQHGAELLSRFVEDWWRTWTRAIGDWLVGGECPALAVAVSLVACAAVLADAARHRCRAAVTVAFVVLWSALVAFSFEPVDRTLLPIAPLVLATTVACLRRVLPAKVGWLLLVGWFVTVVVAAPRVLARFVRSHAVGEVALAARLRAEHGPTVTVASTFACLGLHARVRAVRVVLPAGDAAASAVWACVTSQAGGADYFVTSTASYWGSLPALASATPPGAEVVWNDGDVLGVRLPSPEVSWLAEATVVPEPSRAHLALRVRVNPLPDVLGAGFVVTAPGGEPTLLPLQRQEAGDYVATTPMPPASSARRRWRFVPACMLGDGRILHAPVIELDLP